MRLLILNGPNINMLGIRNKEIYGDVTYKELISLIKKHAKERNIKVSFYQSNEEGKLITFIQKNYNKFDGFIVNLGAYTHYSYALRDTLEIVNSKIVEVHISDVKNREEFRKPSVLDGISSYKIIGKGTEGYLLAIDWLIENK